MQNSFRYGIDELTTGIAIKIANGECSAFLDEQAIAKINTSTGYVDQIVQAETTVYGINTGFGVLASTKISAEDTALLQHKILQSHSVGVGNAIPIFIAKLMLITKLHALAQGFSGVRLETLERILWMLANDIIPVV